MQLKHSIRSTFVVLLGASALAASASAGGEPKNQWPFTRPVGDRTTQAAASSSSVQEPVIQGEPKNEPPFTRPVGNRTTQAAASTSPVQEPVIQGERKNEPPFTRPATVIVQSSGGFSWTDAGIGLMAGIGIAASGVGIITLARKSPLAA